VDEKIPDVSPSCSSSECRWGNFSSLAICVAVSDVSDKLIISNRTIGVNLGFNNNGLVRNASLPNGVSLIGSTSTYNLNMSSSTTAQGVDSQENFLPATASLAFSNGDGKISSAIANFFVVYTNQTATIDSEDAVFRAVEVLLYFCVNTYQVAMSRGVSVTTRVDSSTSVVPATSPSSTAAGVVLRTPHDETEYSVNRNDVRPLNNYLVSLFSGTYSFGHGQEMVGLTSTSDVLGTAMFRGTTGKYSEDDLRAVIGNLTQNVATSLTNT
jgi:hypothetical protein